MSPKLIARLQHWKFTQACDYLDGEAEEVQQIVQALARLVGDCGRLEGDFAIVIEAALARLTLAAWRPPEAARSPYVP